MSELDELLADYIAYRAEGKRPLTQVGEKRARMKLERLEKQGYDITKVVERSIECGWLGLFERDEYKKPVRALRETPVVELVSCDPEIAREALAKARRVI